jgi:hypothetical protein
LRIADRELPKSLAIFNGQSAILNPQSFLPPRVIAKVVGNLQWAIGNPQSSIFSTPESYCQSRWQSSMGNRQSSILNLFYPRELLPKSLAIFNGQSAILNPQSFLPPRVIANVVGNLQWKSAIFN